ncbi:MAG: hypothetical protein D6706_16660, partial [Chloroflexi bacterium]
MKTEIVYIPIDEKKSITPLPHPPAHNIVLASGGLVMGLFAVPAVALYVGLPSAAAAVASAFGWLFMFRQAASIKKRIPRLSATGLFVLMTAVIPSVL